jgi:hypothetical protein
MQPPSEEVIAAAADLRSGGTADDLSLPTVRLRLDAGLGPVRLARPETATLALLVPTAPGRRLPEGLSGEGLVVGVAPYRLANGMYQPFVQVSCADANLESAFFWLISAVLARLQEGRPPEAAVAETIGQFRDLMRRARLFPLERLVGLAGELHVLGRLLTGRPDAAQAWTGPLRHRHDFSLPAVCIEAKSTVREGARIRIHGLDQLDPPDDGRPLVLAHLRYEHGGTGGRSVGGMIEAVRAACADPLVLDQRLASMDLAHWPLIECFRRETFALVAEHYYRVDTAFPRLSPQSFLPGHPVAAISGLEYAIDLSLASHRALDPAQVQALMTAEAA